MTDTQTEWLALGEGLAAEPTPEGGAALVTARKKGRFLETTWEGLAIPAARRWLALAHSHLFVQSPTWGTNLAETPPRTVFLLVALDEGYGAVAPLLDGDFQCELRGGKGGDGGGLAVHADAGPRGEPADELVVAAVARADRAYDAVDRVMQAALKRMGRARPRAEKATPGWVDELGWCTYDAFYNAVDEKRILDGLQAFADGGVNPRYLIVDGGWQDAGPEGKRGSWNALSSFNTKPDAFTDDRLGVVAKTAREQFGLRHVGAWHTLFGCMRGAHPEADAMKPYNPRYVFEPETDDDVFGCVDAERVDAFFDDYHAPLAADGVDFVKVDFQCALARMTYDKLGRVEAARRWHDALQGSASKHLPAGVLNCMAMANDMVYQTHTSNVTRSSDDFYPGKPDTFPRHVRQNLYNAVWLGRVVWPDWDMFWSGESYALYNAIARAVSGGPVYVSDRPGESDAALLDRFIAADGRLLRADQPAQPTPDTLFHDPAGAGRLIKAFTFTGQALALGLFHPDSPDHGVAITESVAAPCAAELDDDEAVDRYAVWSAGRGWLGVFGRDVGVPATLAPYEADLLTFAPVVEGVAIVGLTGKFLPAAAVRSVTRGNNAVEVELRGGGAFAFAADRGVAGATLDGEAVEVARHEGYLTVDTGAREAARITIALK